MLYGIADIGQWEAGVPKCTTINIANRERSVVSNVSLQRWHFVCFLFKKIY